MMPHYFKDNGYKTMAVGKIFHQGVTDYKDKMDDFWDEVAPDYKVPKDLKDRGDGYGGTKFYPFPRDGSQIVNHYGKDFNSGHSLCWGALEREDMPGGKIEGPVGALPPCAGNSFSGRAGRLPGGLP